MKSDKREIVRLNEKCFQNINRYKYNITKKEYDALNHSLAYDEFNFNQYINLIGYSVKATRLSDSFQGFEAKVLISESNCLYSGFIEIASKSPKFLVKNVIS